MERDFVVPNPALMFVPLFRELVLLVVEGQLTQPSRSEAIRN